MTAERIQRAVSADGTEIAGRVHGQGPALVLVHGGIGDGDLAWDALLPHVTDRFTCHLPSTRGRGLSTDNPDHSPPRMVEDITAYVDSIGEPVTLVGWSGSGVWVLGAAARIGSVAAVVEYEPGVMSEMREDDLAQTIATMERMGMAAADGRLVDAVRAFAPWIATDDEITALELTDFFERWAGGIPAMLRFVQGDQAYQGPRPTDPDGLRQVAAPVLLLRGQRTRLGTFFADAVQYLAQHIPDAEVRELPGVGHFAPLLQPEAIADELIAFVELIRQPA
ncbi:MAG TPA: alpha/beta hydrolase [Jiangellaceae bacterium]|nr:alpha/beta hydrolase [Jiangellaceae bacterium]